VTYPIKNCDEVGYALHRAARRFRFEPNLETFIGLIDEVARTYRPGLSFTHCLDSVLSSHKELNRQEYEGYKFALGKIFGTRAVAYRKRLYKVAV